MLLKILQINGQLKVQISTKVTFIFLGGTISSAGQRKEDLLINSLTERVVIRDNIDEVIIATSATVEGQTTAYYIKE